MKILGYIDLPDMAAPTAISAAGNRIGNGHNLNGKYAELVSQSSIWANRKSATPSPPAKDKYVPDTSGYAARL